MWNFRHIVRATESKEAEVDACDRLAFGPLICAELLLQFVERQIEREKYAWSAAVFVNQKCDSEIALFCTFALSERTIV